MFKAKFSDNPFIFHAIRSWIMNEENPYESSWNYLLKDENIGELAEAVTCDHLLRWLEDSYNLSFPQSTRKLYYWRNKKGKEVDFIFEDQSKYIPIEVKYRKKVSSYEFDGLASFLRSRKTTTGIVLSKDVFKSKHEGKNYTVVPLPVMLCLF